MFIRPIPPCAAIRWGRRCFYESLENLADLTLGRNYYFLHSLKPKPDTTFFYLGTSADDDDPVPAELIGVFDRLAESGGRLVMTFLPINREQKKRPK